MAAEPMERANYARTREEPASLKSSPRCQAQTRAGTSCNSPSVKGRKRCRFHGGAKGSGGQKGEANGSFKHGGFTAEAVKMRQDASRLLKMVRDDDLSLDGDDVLALEMMRALFGGKPSRAERSERNRAAWQGRDRTRWGGEDRRGWPKRPGCKGYRGTI